MDDDVRREIDRQDREFKTNLDKYLTKCDDEDFDDNEDFIDEEEENDEDY